MLLNAIDDCYGPMGLIFFSFFMRLLQVAPKETAVFLPLWFSH